MNDARLKNIELDAKSRDDEPQWSRLTLELVTAPQKKLIPWDRVSKSALEARVYCQQCGKSKVIKGYSNMFWQADNVGKETTTQCDSCRSFISYRILREGVEI